MMIYGRNPVFEALKSGAAEVVFIAEGIQQRTEREVRRAADRAGVPVKMVPRIELDTRLKTTNHQGLAAEVSETQTVTLEALIQRGLSQPGYALFVLVDHITDPRNLGAIVRNADAFGAVGVIVEDRRSAPINATVAKASAGATAHVPIAVVPNLPRAITELKEANVWVYGAAGEAQPDSLARTDFQRHVGIVIGSEGDGLRRLVRERCDDLISIPMHGRINSLNASVAAGILLYHVRHNQRTP